MKPADLSSKKKSEADIANVVILFELVGQTLNLLVSYVTAILFHSDLHIHGGEKVFLKRKQNSLKRKTDIQPLKETYNPWNQQTMSQNS